MGLLKHLCMTGQCQPHQRAPSPRRRPPELDTLRTGPMPSPQRSADKYQVARSGQLRSNSRMLTSLQSREGVDAMLELDRLYRYLKLLTWSRDILTTIQELELVIFSFGVSSLYDRLRSRLRHQCRVSLCRSRCRPVLWHIQSPSGRAQELEKRSQAYQIGNHLTLRST